MKKYELLINGRKYEVEIRSLDDGRATVLVNGNTYQVEVLGEQVERMTHQAQPFTPAPGPRGATQIRTTAKVRKAATTSGAASASKGVPQPATAPKYVAPSRPAPAPAAAPADIAVKAGPGDVTAPMPGLVLEVRVKEGDKVTRGDVVVCMESMKMVNDILATRDGEVVKVHVEKGSEVKSGQVLVTIGD